MTVAITATIIKAATIASFLFLLLIIPPQRNVAAEREGAGPADPLFTGRGGNALTADALSHLIHDLGERAGVKVWPHLLRHAFATQFLRGGGSVWALRRLLGHVSDALLTRYAEIVEADLQAAHAEASPADRWRL